MSEGNFVFNSSGEVVQIGSPERTATDIGTSDWSGKRSQPAIASAEWPIVPESTISSCDRSSRPRVPASAPSAPTACSSRVSTVRSREISRERAEVRVARREASSRERCRSVMSRAITEAPTTVPSSSRRGETANETKINRPSFVTRSVS